MNSYLYVPVDDEDLRALAATAAEEGVDIAEQARRVLKAAVAVWRAEDRDGVPAGPMGPSVRPKRWQPRRVRPAPPLPGDGAPPPPISLGDPEPGRSALDHKRLQEAP